jgi:pimeloyl-ACP methyl ester carboxylesterase
MARDPVKKKRSRRRRGHVGWRVVAVLLFALAAVNGWFCFTEYRRVDRESLEPQSLATSQSRFVTVSDARLHIQEWGDPADPTLVLTHGTGAWSGTWFDVPGTLARAGWHVVAVDLPPFGLSQADGGYTRQAQAARLGELVEQLGVPVTLVGHSFGAGPALEAAMQLGDRVRQLVLVDPALGLGADGSAPKCEPGGGFGPMEVRGLRTALVGTTATWPGFTPTLLKQFVYRKDVVTDALVAPYQVPFARRGFSASLGDWAMAFAGSACEPAASLRPAALTQWAAHGPPVVLLWGEQDTVTPIVQAHSLTAWMPGAALHTLPGVGHIPHIEDPVGFQAALLRVLVRPEAM